MVDEDRDVIVIGGGISGLTAAWHLKRAGVDLCLLEGDKEVGGVTRTERRDGFLLEKGPFNVIVRDPTFEALLDGVADEVKVVTADRAARKRYLYRGGRLLAVPTDPVRLLTTPLLSMGAKWRLVSGLIASRRSQGREETIEQVAIRRFGKEVTDTMISAVVAGIFAGDIRRLSLKACFPTIAGVDGEARSLIGYGIASAFRSKKGKKQSHRRRWRGLVSFEGGLGALTQALGRSLGSGHVSDCRVQEIRSADAGYEVVCRKGDGTSLSLRCRRLVLAPSADETARLLEALMPDAAKILRTIESAPMVVLNLGFKKADVGHPLEGFGFLAPHDETGYPLLGILWADSIFPHHAPPDHRLIRVFIGGSRDPDAAGRSDDELLTISLDASRDLLHLSGEPVLVDVCRYPEAIPQYGLRYMDKIERLRTLIASRPNLHLVGNYLEGVSLNDCIRCATNTAEKIIRTADRVDDVDLPAMVGSR
jgi:oxygen-dependent protoporphyrinogen oxidase